jgi:hypothetical protein
MGRKAKGLRSCSSSPFHVRYSFKATFLAQPYLFSPCMLPCIHLQIQATARLAFCFAVAASLIYKYHVSRVYHDVQISVTCPICGKLPISTNLLSQSLSVPKRGEANLKREANDMCGLTAFGRGERGATLLRRRTAQTVLYYLRRLLESRSVETSRISFKTAYG